MEPLPAGAYVIDANADGIARLERADGTLWALPAARLPAGAHLGDVLRASTADEASTTFVVDAELTACSVDPTATSSCDPLRLTAPGARHASRALGRAVLYDTRRIRDDVPAALARLGVTALDLLVLSHQHADHIGDAGLDQDGNTVGLVIEHGAVRMIVAGDAYPIRWAARLADHRDLPAPVQVLRASHHGSRTGCTDASLEALRPEVVIISVGGNSAFGHPHAEAMVRYRRHAHTVLRTDERGAIVIRAWADGRFELVTER